MSGGKPTWLVTGGAGFIGYTFVLGALAGGHTRVVNLDKLGYAANQQGLRALQGNSNHVFVKGDIGDRALVDRLLKEYQPEAIINFAAESHVDRSILGPAAFIETNVVGTSVLLESSLVHWKSLPESERSAFRFLHVSTDEVYGTLAPDDPAFSETTPYAPNSPYAASKASSDHFVRAYHHTYGLPVLTTNCSNNYGPWQFPEKMIPLMITNALEGKPLPVYGDGQQIRDWLYVTDHCTAIEKVLARGRVGETYNIGGNNQRANLDVVRMIGALLDDLRTDSPHKPHANLIHHVTDRPGHDRRYAIDDRKLRAELGWAPRESFESGLEKTVRWYLEHRDWVALARSGDWGTWVEANYGRRKKEVS